MSEQIDIAALYREERQRWLREEAPRRTLRDTIADSVPFWIILVALVLYGLSAPHTAAVFDKLTPGWGWIAPVGVEFGLLYAAFRRRVARAAEEEVSWTLWFLEVLLFCTAMLVNGAGSFSSVVSAVHLDHLSFNALTEQFGNLPATSQAALVMAILSAFIIPVGTLVAGEGLAVLVLERRSGGADWREARWREVELSTTYRALFVRYLQTGLPDKDARARALAEAKGYLVPAGAPGVRLLSAVSVQPAQSERTPRAQPSSAKAQVISFLAKHPEAAQLSINQLTLQLTGQGLHVGRTTVAEVLRDLRCSA